MLAPRGPLGPSPAVRRAVIAVALLASVSVAAVDAAIADELSLSAAHILALGAAGWCGGFGPAAAIAGIAGGDALLHTLRSGTPGGWGLVAAGGIIEAGVLLAAAAAVAWGRRLVVAHAERATHDSLTGALTRAAFHEIAERELRRVSRHGGSMSVAYFDIDDFKRLNDSRGHAEGDRVLRMVAAAVVGSVRAGDAFARVGGDEFVLLLPDTDAVDAAAVVRRVLTAARAARIGGRMPVGLSVGVATFREPPGAVHDMVTHADELMYRAKHAGGDRVVGAVVHPASTPWPIEVSIDDDRLLEALAGR